MLPFGVAIGDSHYFGCLVALWSSSMVRMAALLAMSVVVPHRCHHGLLASIQSSWLFAGCEQLWVQSLFWWLW